MIVSSVRQVAAINEEISIMQETWEHINLCLNKFDQYMKTKWLETKPGDMDEEVKRL